MIRLAIAEGVSRELLWYGLPLFVVVAATALLPCPWCWLALVPFSLLVLLLWFFRDPNRTLPKNAEQGFIAPADGLVVDITRIDHYDFFGGQPAQVIGIYLSLLNVHVNRIPASGIVVETHYKQGEFHHANHQQSAQVNESMWIGIETPHGLRYAMRQVSGAVARRIVCRLIAGQPVVQGNRFGIIKLGSRAELILPADLPLKIQVGDRVLAGNTCLATLS